MNSGQLLCRKVAKVLNANWGLNPFEFRAVTLSDQLEYLKGFADVLIPLNSGQLLCLFADGSQDAIKVLIPLNSGQLLCPHKYNHI